MIRRCTSDDFETIYEIVNDAARAYKGVIPADRWHEPYMSRRELAQAIEDGVRFWGFENDDPSTGTALIGVMGIQDVQDVTLIRHAYVRTAQRGQGIGSKMLTHLLSLTERPVLVGTWAAATWAVRFYQKHGFRLVTQQQQDHLLHTYWTIPKRQVTTSVVLADQTWFDIDNGSGSI